MLQVASSIPHGSFPDDDRVIDREEGLRDERVRQTGSWASAIAPEVVVDDVNDGLS